MIDQVKKFISEKLGVSNDEIHEEQTLESDFGIAGLDTIEFFRAFFEEFSIENPQDFNINKYVTSEMLDPVSLVRNIFSKEYLEKHRVREVTVGHLVRVVELKRWVDVI